MRTLVLTISLAFIAGLAVLTVLDIVRYGLTGVSVLALIVLTLFCTGILGALRPPRR